MSQFFNPYTCTESEYNFFDVCSRLERFLRRQKAGIAMANYYDDNGISGSWIGINIWEQAVEDYRELYPSYQKYVKLVDPHRKRLIFEYIQKQ